MLPPSRRAVAWPLSLRHRPGPYFLRSRATSRMARPRAMISMSLTSPMISKVMCVNLISANHRAQGNRYLAPRLGAHSERFASTRVGKSAVQSRDPPPAPVHPHACGKVYPRQDEAARSFAFLAGVEKSSQSEVSGRPSLGDRCGDEPCALFNANEGQQAWIRGPERTLRRPDVESPWEVIVTTITVQATYQDGV